MAEPARDPKATARAIAGRIRPSDADAVLAAALTFLVANIVTGEDEERALALIARALPMTSSTTAMQPLVQAAMALDRAAQGRFRPSEGSLNWHKAMFAARRAIAARAMARCMEAVQ